MLIDRLLGGRGGRDRLGKVYLIYFLHRPLEQQLYFLVLHVGVVVLLSAVNLTVSIYSTKKKETYAQRKIPTFFSIKTNKNKII